MTLDHLINMAQKYGRLIGILMLLAFVLLSLLSMFGVQLIPIAKFGPQETGILIAGLAYALKG